MKFLFSFLSAVILSSVAFANINREMPGPVQFQKGNNIEIEQLSGSVTYYCRDHLGNNYSRHWFCDRDLFKPGTHDYVVSLAPIDADKVTLTCTHADGSTKTKTVGYDAQKSISKSRINLVIRTLTQQPLLAMGNNTVAYKFTKGKETVSEGTFNSEVAVTGKTQCRPRSWFANTNSYCDNQNMGCDNYFAMEHNCLY